MAMDLGTVMDRLGRLVVDEGTAAEREREWQERQRRERVAHLRLPLTIERALLTGVDEHGRALRETDASVRLRQRLGAGKRLVVLQGVPGTGKSYAAALALAEHERARWVSSVELCRLADWDPAVDGYRYTHWLGVDDLGVEQPRARSRVEALLYDRHAEGKTTICTTNLSADEFQRAYNDRVLSRLREVGAWIECAEVVRPGERTVGNEQRRTAR